MVEEIIESLKKEEGVIVFIEDLEHWRVIQPFTTLKYQEPLIYKEKGITIHFNKNSRQSYGHIKHVREFYLNYKIISSYDIICKDQTIYELW